MEKILDKAWRFRGDIFAKESTLYQKLAHDGQSPKALMISCADSRVVPELITQAQPGDLFVCRNAGNIVPPFSQANGGVSSAVEYAVVALEGRDIVICGHSGCGAMKAFLHPDKLEEMPNVATWLRHAHAAESVVKSAYPKLEGHAKVRALALENVVAQINHLRTHPSVAAALARGELDLHGWFFEIDSGTISALDGQTGQFVEVSDNSPLPVALAGRQAAAPQPLRALAR